MVAESPSPVGRKDSAVDQPRFHAQRVSTLRSGLAMGYTPNIDPEIALIRVLGVGEP
jgi:hypothetical protein